MCRTSWGGSGVQAPGALPLVRLPPPKDRTHGRPNLTRDDREAPAWLQHLKSATTALLQLLGGSRRSHESSCRTSLRIYALFMRDSIKQAYSLWFNKGSARRPETRPRPHANSSGFTGPRLENVGLRHNIEIPPLLVPEEQPGGVAATVNQPTWLCLAMPLHPQRWGCLPPYPHAPHWHEADIPACVEHCSKIHRQVVMTEEQLVVRKTPLREGLECSLRSERSLLETRPIECHPPYVLHPREGSPFKGSSAPPPTPVNLPACARGGSKDRPPQRPESRVLA